MKELSSFSYRFQQPLLKVYSSNFSFLRFEYSPQGIFLAGNTKKCFVPVYVLAISGVRVFESGEILVHAIFL